MNSNLNPVSGSELRNLLLAIILATGVMFAWQYFYERPRTLARENAALAETARREQVTVTEEQKKHEKPALAAAAVGPRLAIHSPSLHGSLALTGARFDDLTLANYRETQEPNAPEVRLLARKDDPDAYFVETGMLASDQDVAVPTETSTWQADSHELSDAKPVTLSWNNGAGLAFEKHIALDPQAMFTITTTIKNSGSKPVKLYPYGLISRNYSDTGKHFIFMHEGPLAVVNHVLDDVTYKTLREDGDKKYEQGSGWLGLADKYWLTALVPDQNLTFDSTLKHFMRDGADAYQVDLRGQAIEVPAGGSASFTMHLFTGAKVVKQLDNYGMQYNIPLFDRAVDFGSLYFLTKPIFTLMNYFHGIVGNFGVAILLLTVVIKALLFPLANKSITAMARTKQLMPKVTEIKAKHAGDKMKMNQEVMALYKREKVNPVAGCLPLLLQIPVFISLYRVLFVTIEMRQAPFFGWIHDLSVPDPSNIFTLFGLVPWVPPHFLHLGIWPMVMCATMVIQQKLNPKPADEVQAMVMTYMPFMFLILFANFPAGLIIYWAWNNTLTILQTLYINHGLKKKGLR